MKKDWRPKVYHPKKIGKNKFRLKNWLEMREYIILRDNYTCQMCKNVFDTLFDLTVHHIKPRKKSGKDTSRNLITLCSPCHDTAELEQLNKSEILYYDRDVEDSRIKKNKGLKWQQWVYGGYKRP